MSAKSSMVLPQSRAGVPSSGRPPFYTQLAVWLHADLGMVLSGADITTLTDQKSGKVATGVADNEPQFNATGFNRRASVEIDTDNQGFSMLSGAGAWTTGGTIATIIAAAKRTPTIATKNGHMYANEANRSRIAIETDEVDYRSADGNFVTVDESGGGVSDHTVEGIHVHRYNGTAFDGWFNGTAYSQNTDVIAVADFAGDMYLFRDASGNSEAFLGHCRIFLVYDAGLTVAQINNVINNYVEPETGLSTSDIT